MNDNAYRSTFWGPTNLLGICFAIFILIRAMNIGESTYIDELAIVAVFLFLGSCLFSYASMRSRNRRVLYEKIADVIFITALGFLSLLALKQSPPGPVDVVSARRTFAVMYMHSRNCQTLGVPRQSRGSSWKK